MKCQEGGLDVFRVKISSGYRLLYTVDEDKKTVRLLRLLDHSKYEAVYKKKGGR
jgi:mRNA-degrading endonuclease RelE of RelBE toxin-antitoxin system